MFRTLHSRLLLAFLIVSVSGVVILTLIIQIGVRNSFNQYLDVRREEQMNRMVEILEGEYRQKGEITGEAIGSLLHQQGMTEGLFYQIYDEKGRLLADSTRMMEMMGMMGKMGGVGRTETTGATATIPLAVEGKPIGKLVVYQVGGNVESQTIFLHSFYQSLFLSALVMLIVSFLLSWLFSKELTSGLRRLGEAVRELKGHNYAVELTGKGTPQEMQDLILSFNELVHSLNRQERLRKEFTNDLAHELRTPLSTLRSQIEAFRDGVWEPTPERLAETHGELMRLVRLVNEMEQLLMAENPNLPLRKEKIDLHHFLSQLVAQISPLFQEKGVSFHYESPGKGVSIWADRDRLMQIMMNLINNALKYTPPEGKVTLILRKKEDEAEIEVKDTGVGISEEDLPHIFERFYRGDKSRDRRTGGIGIGLSIVKALVVAHKGRIEVKSKPGKGSRFILSFPSISYHENR
ncbi:sensor histidine kinase [Thermicanus aegyptius]|uniref:sensor histidine kinase n=1 Tax=Thermicanus aegyptius TaxID=94009 RepID=UPI000406C377|nr:HAMP domain-containing sensor histidine kinase [Thermicanus aegyptius]